MATLECKIKSNFHFTMENPLKDNTLEEQRCKDSWLEYFVIDLIKLIVFSIEFINLAGNVCTLLILNNLFSFNIFK